MSEPHVGTVAHQFDDAHQQKETATLGMWSFLITEVMMFGGLFLGYTVYRTVYSEAFVAGSHELDVVLGAFNTVVLICSSLTMAMAVHSAQTNKKKATAVFILLTMLLGLTFLGVKVIEYGHKYQENLMPGPGFEFHDPSLAPQARIFFSFYFAMTGLHALHMVVGIGIMTYLLVLTRKGRFSPEYYSPVELSGLYWHFVDIVWIFLFPLLYLVGAHV